MPELPDVEVFRRYMDETSLHQKIKSVDVLARDILAGVSEEDLKKGVEGHRLEATRRHGKYMFASLSDDGWLAFHFGMTGYFEYSKDEEEHPEHTRVLFRFDNGYRLAFVLQRKLGKITLTGNVENFIREHNPGKDALDISMDDFKKTLEGARGSIKSALMNQDHIAGIGNVYSDEILFRARLHPRANPGQLDARTVERLFKAMKEVLKTAIGSRADPDQMPGDYLLPQRGKGGECPVCGGKIRTEKITGRTAYFCPGCQK